MNEKRQPVQLKDIVTSESNNVSHSKHIHASLFKIIATGNLNNIKNMISLYHNSQGFKINFATDINDVLEPNDSNYIVFDRYCWTLRWTYIFLAVAKQYTEIVSYLLKNFAREIDLNRKDAEGFTVFHRACYNGNTAIVKLLLEYKVDPTTTNNQYFSPLHDACSQGHTEIVQLICEIPEVNVDSIDKYGATPLILAAQRNFKSCCEILLRHNANPNIATYNGITALHISAANNIHDVTYLLLKSKANIYAMDNEGRTPFEVATFECKSLIQNWKLQTLIVRFFEEIKSRMDTLSNSFKLEELKEFIGGNLLDPILSRLDAIEHHIQDRSSSNAILQSNVHDMSIDESPTKKRSVVLELTVIDERNKKLYEIQFDRQPSYDMLVLEISKILQVPRERIQTISKWSLDNEVVDDERMHKLKAKDVISVFLV